LAGDSSSINKYNNFAIKEFGDNIIYWDAMPNDLVKKYEPISTGSELSYPKINEEDMNKFYNTSLLSSVMVIQPDKEKV
jgi:hypothetical protein